MRSNRLIHRRPAHLRSYQRGRTGHPSYIWPARLVCLIGLAWLIGNTALVGQQPNLGSQLPNPRLMTVFPNGAKVGTTVEVVFTGTDVEDPTELIFSHPGIKGEAIQPPAPAPDPKKKDPPPPKPPVTKFKVTVAPNTPLGNHDVRLVNKWGVSNPRAFVVGDLNDILEKDPNNDVPEAQRVEINTTINGSIAAPTDVDYYVFKATKGQRVIISCLSSSIDSRLLTGLEIYDTAGRRLGENRNYNDNDALMDLTAPADGDYYVRLYEFTHLQGTQEHFYRLSITTAPWIDAVYPPMVEPGKTAQVTIYGRNLPDGKADPAAVVDGRVLEKATATVTAPSDPAGLVKLNFSGNLPPIASGLDGFEFRTKNAAGSSNPFLMTYARAPVVIDNEKNDTQETAQEVPVPCEIAGRIEKKRDRDWYSFALKKGDVVNLEVFSDRLGAPTDMAFHLYNAENKQSLFGEVDDNPETLNPLKFFTKSNDPARLRVAATADTKYQLFVKSQDADVRAGIQHFYRISITPEKPDFRLIVLPPDDHRPDASRLLQGSNQYFTALLWRLDGFNGPVTITADGLPGGVAFPPQTMGPGVKQTTVVLSATPAAAQGVYELKLKGTATIAGQPVVREARAASITWPTQPQTNVPSISRLDRGLFTAIRDQPPFNLTLTIDKAELFPGDKANLTIKLNRLWPDFKQPLQVTAMDMPLANNQPTITINNNQPVAMAPGKDDATAVVEAKSNATPGTYNLVVRGTAQIPYAKDPMAKQKPNTNIVLPSTPITLIVNPKQVANVTLPTPNVQTKLGAQSEVIVKVARMYDFDGEFKVQLVLPPNVKGFSADEVTIPAGKDEAKLIVKVAADAPVGNRPDLIVRATAMYNGKVPTTQETKLAVNVVK